MIKLFKKIFEKFKYQSVLRRNIFFNIAGTLWSGIMQFAFVPVYLHLLGIEAYGLIAFSLTIQALLVVMEMGLAPAMNYEMARLAPGEGSLRAHDFVRTSEMLSWGVGLAIGGAVAFFAPEITRQWIKVGNLDIKAVEGSIALLGLMIAFQIPQSLYNGGLLGLQRHDVLNSLGASFATIQNVGAVLILYFYSPTIIAFFAWRSLSAFLKIFFTRVAFLRCLPKVEQTPGFNPGKFKEAFKFAIGMSGITITGIILTQVDKVVLSKTLELNDYGLYMLAAAVANALTMLSAPLFNSFFPLFTSLVAQKDFDELEKKYHLNTQLMGLALIPAAMIMIFFSSELLLLWTGKPEVASGAASAMSVLALGTALNGMMLVPFALQLAHGQTRLGFYIGITLVLTMVPSVLYMASTSGMVSVASVWVLLNAVYMVFGIPLTHKLMLKEAGKGFFLNVSRTLFVTLAAGIFFRCVFPSEASKIVVFLFILVAGTTMFLITAISGDRTREYLKIFMGKFRLAFDSRR